MRTGVGTSSPVAASKPLVPEDPDLAIGSTGPMRAKVGNSVCFAGRISKFVTANDCIENFGPLT